MIRVCLTRLIMSLVAGHVGTEALNLPADDNSGGGDDGLALSATGLRLDRHIALG